MDLIFIPLDALGAAHRAADESAALRIAPSEASLALVRRLATAGLGLGILEVGLTSAALEQALAAAGVRGLFAPGCVLGLAAAPQHGGLADALEQARAAAAGAGAGAARLLLISEHRELRAQARRAGWLTAPHLVLAQAVLAGEALHYARLTAEAAEADRQALPWRQLLRERELAPLRVTGRGGRVVYAIVPTRELLALCDLGFQVDRLGPADAPVETELYLLRDDKQVRTGFLRPEGSAAAFFKAGREPWLLGASPEGLLVAIPAGARVEDCHFSEARHGHNLRLGPSLGLLSPFSADEDAVEHTRLAGWARPRAKQALSQAELEAIRAISADELAKVVGRLSGQTALAAVIPGQRPGTRIQSRHVQHPGNAVVVAELCEELRRAGGGRLQLSRQEFSHETQQLSNLIAELPGQSSEVVVVSAHLDSTAGTPGPHYCPERDAAPGADDDASGVAAVLAIARTLTELAQKTGRPPQRTIRFALFNAEEQGLVGSAMYARAQADAAAAIVGVFQMDMIGFCSAAAPATFELHVGYAASAEVTQRSLRLAELCREVAPQVASGLLAPEIYKSHDDPAGGRSDHASFHQYGYAACVVSEDFFTGFAPDAPPQNPHYHTAHDLSVTAAYAADIARVVAAAAWQLANPS